MACVNCPTITMTSRTTVRTAAIVGRPNVGKSALFNRFAGRRISIVHDQPGVTRDRIAADCNLVGAPFTVVDTGGIGSNPDDTFSDAIEQEADLAMEAAEHGVRVNAVAPSLAMHEFLSKVTPDGLLEELVAKEAFGRAAEPFEVANVMIFLASDYASYMTGEVVAVSSQHP